MYSFGVIFLALSVVAAEITTIRPPQTIVTSLPPLQYVSSSGLYNGGYSLGSGYGSYKGIPSQGLYLGSSYGETNGYQNGAAGLGTTYTTYSGIGSSGSTLGATPIVSLPTTSISTGLPSLATGLNYQTVGTGVNFVRPLSIYTSDSNAYPGYNQFQSNYQAQKYQQSYQFLQQPAQVYKHFYVHAAPEDPEPIRARTPIVLPPPQKHYKIIFVKTPSQTRSSQIIPVHLQNEEKTIVYVLSKKPEDYQDIIVPKIEQKGPSKPEVYFIKYNNNKDEQGVIDNIVNDYNKGQPLTSIPSAATSDTNIYANSAAPALYGTSGSAIYTSGTGSGASYGSAGGAGVIYDTGLATGTNIPLETVVSSVTPTVSVASVESDANGIAGIATGGVTPGFSTVSSTAVPYTVTTTSSALNYEPSYNTYTSSQIGPQETYNVPKFRLQ